MLPIGNICNRGLNNGGQKIFISFLLCVWLAELGPPRLDSFLTDRFFSFNISWTRTFTVAPLFYGADGPQLRTCRP